MIQRAVAAGSDATLIDLEDSVAPAGKLESRQNVVRAIRELDWGSKLPMYRMNALDTPFFYRDVIDIVEQSGGRLGTIVIPKVQRAQDVITIDTLLRGIEANIGLAPGRIGIAAQIETAAGLVHAEAIAGSSSRLNALVFGPGDFSASVGMPLTSIGAMDEWDAAYPGHRFHYAMARIVVAARAAGLRAIDGPSADYRDAAGLRQSCMIARSLGYTGKWCIHPDQIPTVHDVFSPSAQEVAWAQKVATAYRQAADGGTGAISVDDRMIDMASVRMAETTLELAARSGRD